MTLGGYWQIGDWRGDGHGLVRCPFLPPRSSQSCQSSVTRFGFSFVYHWLKIISKKTSQNTSATGSSNPKCNVLYVRGYTCCLTSQEPSLFVGAMSFPLFVSSLCFLDDPHRAHDGTSGFFNISSSPPSSSFPCSLADLSCLGFYLSRQVSSGQAAAKRPLY